MSAKKNHQIFHLDLVTRDANYRQIHHTTKDVPVVDYESASKIFREQHFQALRKLYIANELKTLETQMNNLRTRPPPE